MIDPLPNKLDPKIWSNNKAFVVILILLEIVMLVFLKLFYQVTIYDESTIKANPSLNTWYYPMYQDINAMMLVGFGFLLTFIKFGSWQALAYTFLINSIVLQYYILWNTFWVKLMYNKWNIKTSMQVFINEKTFTAASYSVASVLVAFGAVLGRVGPYQLLLMAMIQIIAYSLN